MAADDQLGDVMAFASDQAAEPAEVVAPAPAAPPANILVPEDTLAFALDGDSRVVIASQIGTSPEGRILEGDVAAAVSHLREHTCPRLLIVDISTADDPMAELDSLADVVVPGTIVITLGATNDVSLYRRLRAAGVADYLVKPLTPELVSEALQAALVAQAGPVAQTMQGKLFCFVGARGGVGASTLAANTAAVLAREGTKNIGLVDLDIHFGTIALSLDVEASPGLREGLEDPDRIDAMFVDSAASAVGERFHVMAAEEPLNEPTAVDAEHLSAFLSHMRQHYDVVIVDVPVHKVAEWWPALAGATKMIIVTDLSLSGLRDTGRVHYAAKGVVEPSRLMLVANRVGADKHGMIERVEFERALESKFDLVIPDDAKAAGAAARAGKPIVDMAKDGKLLGGVRKLCGDLVGAAADGEKDSKAAKKRGFRLPFSRKKGK